MAHSPGSPEPLPAAQVHSQGELTVRIDDNVSTTLSNMDNAQAQLLRYLSTISQNRWLVLKVFLVLMAFLGVFIVFVA